MKLLITNDDGVFAPGIAALAGTLVDRGRDLVVVAPDRERSSVGHAITLSRPLRLWPVISGLYERTHRVFAADGTPSDCVVLGLEEVAPDATLVISGINRGPNLGDDLTYSGTVSAAMEGVILGRPALAVSLGIAPGDGTHHYDTAAAVTARLVDRLESLDLPRGVLLNVNVPNVPYGELRGVVPTRKGVRLYLDKVSRRTDPRGNTYYWMSGRPEDELTEGTDVWAVASGYVSVTPVHMDLTHYPTLQELDRVVATHPL